MSIRLPDFLVQHFGAEIVLQRLDDPSVDVVVVAFPDDRRMILVERSYRSGVRFLTDPTAEEMEVAESGDPWRLWNSERSVYLSGLG